MQTLHSNLGICQAAWHTICDDEVSLHFNAFFLACRVEPTRCAVLYIQNIAETRISMWRRTLFTSKTETKPFTQNAYLLHFLEGHFSVLRSRLTQESPKPCYNELNYWIKKISLLANVHIKQRKTWTPCVIWLNVNKLRVSAIINLSLKRLWQKGCCAADRDALFELCPLFLNV